MKRDNTKQNIILTDYNPGSDWQFLKGLVESTNEPWNVAEIVNNRFGNVFFSIKRYLVYFIFPLKILISIQNYKRILAWQQFYGIVLAFYIRLFHVHVSSEITIMTFIFKQKEGVIGKLYFRFVNYAIHCKAVKKIIVFSKSEKEYYQSLFNIQDDVIVSEILGIDPIKIVSSQKEAEFYVSAGRSNRDFDFLFKNWKFGKIKIICDSDLKGNNPDVYILSNCYGNDYIKELANCKAVFIPLKDENISSGQLVVIQAMALGKPCIVTKNNSISDYIDDGLNGFIIEKNESALKDVIEKLKDEKLYHKISASSQNKYCNCFTTYSMGKRIGKYI